MSESAEDYTSFIYSAALLVGGFTYSYVQMKQVLTPRTTLPILFFVSITCTMIFCYISIWQSLFASNAAASNALLTIQYIVDMTTAFCLETCYILRLAACLQMYRYRLGVYFLFVFPVIYVFNDVFAIVNQYTDNAVNINSVAYGMFNMMLIIGGIISHLSAVVILLKNASKFKDERERRHLQYVAIAAFCNQGLYFVFCIVSFFEIVYSVAILYLIWAVDHIIFTKVNQHIKSFLLSTNANDSSDSGGHDKHRNSRISSAPGSPRETEMNKPFVDDSAAKAHERLSTAMTQIAETV